MIFNVGYLILVTALLLSAFGIGVGLWAMRRTTSTSDFFMAGRNLGIGTSSAPKIRDGLLGSAAPLGPVFIL